MIHPNMWCSKFGSLVVYYNHFPLIWDTVPPRKPLVYPGLVTWGVFKILGMWVINLPSRFKADDAWSGLVESTIQLFRIISPQIYIYINIHWLWIAKLLTPSITSRYMVKMVKASFQHQEQPLFWTGGTESVWQTISVDPDVWWCHKFIDGWSSSLQLKSPIFSLVKLVTEIDVHFPAGRNRGSTLEATGVIKKWLDASCTATCFLVVQGEPSTAALFFFLMVFDGFWMVFSYCCTVFFWWMIQTPMTKTWATWATWALWMSHDFGFLRSASGESLSDQWLKGVQDALGIACDVGKTPRKGSSGHGPNTLLSTVLHNRFLMDFGISSLDYNIDDTSSTLVYANCNIHVDCRGIIFERRYE